MYNLISNKRIIWLNGAFGVGKTTIAELLQQKIDNSIIFDPELTGSMLNKIYPIEIKQYDFQYYLEWRSINNLILNKLIKSTNKTIIIPMTILNIDYYFEITNGIPNDYIQPYLLIANESTLKNRLNKRMENDTWPYEQIAKYVTVYKDFEFGAKINTDDNSIDSILNYILKTKDISL
ncbi:tunicamycin resistance protein [Macrococcus animalis]|uniref:tunicamycin resistance protein n=1 Tax=Macrococcus animalis TaxID=3395467 RepID=UPI0039BDF161